MQRSWLTRVEELASRSKVCRSDASGLAAYLAPPFQGYTRASSYSTDRQKSQTASRYGIIRRYFRTAPNTKKLSFACGVSLNLTARPRLCFVGAQSRFVGLRNLTTSSTALNASSRKGQPSEEETPEPQPPPEPEHGINPNLESYSRLYRRLALSMPHLHRPTREDFLDAATNVWQRFRVRFRWFAIRSPRRFTADDISAFLSWFLVGNTVWILLGTTTFFSVVVLIVNSLQMQEYVARKISDLLTAETGITIVFENAIVPKWKGSQISFKNVYISRRPHPTSSEVQRRVFSHHAPTRFEVGHHTAFHDGEDDDISVPEISEEPTEYAIFDLNVDSIDVTLSLWRWLDGKGFIEDAEIKGVRGILDRRNVRHDWSLDPASFRRKGGPGDFELKSLKLEDVLVTIYQPNFRPYNASIFRAEVHRLRQQWLFYDLLSAENVVGQWDNCLFSVHRPQSIGRTTQEETQDGRWNRMTRFRVDGVNIDHLKAVSEGTGPISWITSGKVDAVLDITFPSEPSGDFDINALVNEIVDNITTGTTRSATERIPGHRELVKPALTAPIGLDEIPDSSHQVVIDIDLRFRDLKAQVPVFTTELGYTKNALIRPIVAFINANRTLIPIKCRVVKDLDQFDGAWTFWDSGLLDATSHQIYEALAYHVTHANDRRMKKVGLWSLHMTAEAALAGLKALVDPATTHLYQPQAI